MTGLPGLFPHVDKVAHLGLYALLTGLLAWGIVRGFPGRNLGWVLGLSVGLSALYGVSDEFHQAFVAARQSDVLDWVADAAGSLLAAVLLWWRPDWVRPTGRP